MRRSSTNNLFGGSQFTRSQLRKLLFLVFIAVAIPIGALVWHAYNQLVWESFHQHRTFAENLTNRIDKSLIAFATHEDSRPYTDFSYATSVQKGKTNRLRSPLSNYSSTGGPNGTLGYFQVNEAGEFSSPLLPAANDESLSEFDPEELNERSGVALALNEILGNNQLVQSSPVRDADNRRTDDADASVLTSEAGSRSGVQSVPELESSGTDRDESSRKISLAGEASIPSNELAFDRLKKTTTGLKTDKSAAINQRLNVSELNLDSTYEIRSQKFEEKEFSKQTQNNEQRELAAPKLTASEPQPVVDESDSAGISFYAKNPDTNQEIKITGFDDDVGSLEFGMLDSGHFILFRRVWINNERLIQGLLLSQSEFLDLVFNQPYNDSGLTSFGNLLIAFDEEVIARFKKFNSSRFSRSLSYDNRAIPDDTALLYRRALSAPFGRMQLVYTVSSLPPGPGANVLFWVTLALASVLTGGFYLLYRAGIKQIALARQQQNFVSSVTHELKTPLTSIRMYSEILKVGWPDETKKQEYYNHIHDESERLSRLISNVLKLSSINNSDIDLELQPVELGVLMDRLQPKIETQLKPTGVLPVFRLLPEDSTKIINIDDDSFSQIVINLVDNAVKFSDSSKGNKIDISCHSMQNSEILFSVRDYGPGIPKDQLKRIFELFYRSENELTRETVGTGIGLAIVHQLVGLMGGRVDVVNVSPGAEFRVFLPEQKAALK